MVGATVFLFGFPYRRAVSRWTEGHPLCDNLDVSSPAVPAAPAWRPIPSLGGAYEASDAGTIGRALAARGTRPGRVLAQQRLPAGYMTCSVWLGNRGRTKLVHRLVAEAFLGPCPEDYEVNHRNLDKSDNRPANLQYVTRSLNQLHRAFEGIGRGSTNGSPRLDEEDGRAIRRRHADGEGCKRLGAAYGVSWGTIRSIIKRRSWAWLA